MCKECNDGTLSVALGQLATEILEYCQRQGFEPDPTRTFGEEMSLLNEEVSEAFKAWRKWGFKDMTHALPLVHLKDCNVHKDMRGPCSGDCRPKPEGVASEFADIFIRLLHYSKIHDIDLMAETRRKMEYNKTRPYRHGGLKL